MKRIITITALAAAMTAAATSCSKEEFANQEREPQGKGLVFCATLEDADTKTTIGEGNKISWEATDSISVNGVIYKAKPDQTNPALATFEKVRDADPDPKTPFKAYYPASIYDSTSKTATLPATQVYNEEGSIAGILPMYAESDDMNLNFKNLCGLFKFTLKGTEKVQHITITDDNKALSGKFTVTDNAAVLDPAAKGGVSLDCGADGVQLDGTTGRTFYVAVPAGSYDNLHIEFNTVNYAEYARMKAKSTAAVERSKVYILPTWTPTFKSDWFYFEAVEKGAQVGMSKFSSPPDVSLKYSTNGGSSWNNFTIGTTVTLNNIGDRAYFRANGTNTAFATDANNYNYFTATGAVKVGGNIMYLLNETPGISFAANYGFCYLFKSLTKLISASDLKLPATTMAEKCYYSMFSGCTTLVNAPALPATTLKTSCYQYMFSGCTALANAPALPATTLAEKCYYSMFSGCTTLVNAPALPATTLKTSCYQGMFGGCNALANAPALPATTLAEKCYYQMFYKCTALATAPALPATTLTASCYQYMFSGCTALANAPALPATTLAASCYQFMFQNCSTLVNAPALPATTLADKCYYQMFDGCTSLVTSPVLPAETLGSECYKGMFYGCSKLSSVTMLATNVTAKNCLSGWLSNAGTSEGSHILYVHPSMTDDTTIKKYKENFAVTAYSVE